MFSSTGRVSCGIAVRRCCCYSGSCSEGSNLLLCRKSEARMMRQAQTVLMMRSTVNTPQRKWYSVVVAGPHSVRTTIDCWLTNYSSVCVLWASVLFPSFIYRLGRCALTLDGCSVDRSHLLDGRRFATRHDTTLHGTWI